MLNTHAYPVTNILLVFEEIEVVDMSGSHCRQLHFQDCKPVEPL